MQECDFVDMPAKEIVYRIVVMHHAHGSSDKNTAGVGKMCRPFLVLLQKLSYGNF